MCTRRGAPIRISSRVVSRSVRRNLIILSLELGGVDHWSHDEDASLKLLQNAALMTDHSGNLDLRMLFAFMSALTG
jgi:hypothetical protein